MAGVRINLNGKLARFNRIVSGGSVEVISRIFQSWTKIFGAFIRMRFVRASRGDGTWQPLAESTIARRRKGKGKGSPAILRDTGLLFMHLTPEVKGLAIKDSAPKFEATVEFGGNAIYPDGGVSTSDVAGFHQEGGGYLPQRKIIVPPDVKTKGQMAKSAKKIIADELNG